MKTLFLIILSFIVILIVNTYIVSKEKKRCKKNNERFTHKRVSSRVNSVVIAGLITMFIGIFVINCSENSGTSDSSIENKIESEGFDASCVIAEDFIKRDLRYPAEAEFSILECVRESQNDGSIMVMRKFTAKNGFGVKSEYIYKLYLNFKGGEEYNKNNWELISMEGEEVTY